MPGPDWEALRLRYPRAWTDQLERSDNEAGAVSLSVEELSEWDVDPEESHRFPDPAATATALLAELAASGWLEETHLWSCPICGFEMSERPSGDVCPNPDEAPHAFTDQGDTGVTEIRLLQRRGVARRDVGWLLALHGMNTLGSWQESFNWLVATSYGRMVPVAIYKYGKVRPGVLARTRHDTLAAEIVARLRRASAEARRIVRDPRPDVIAHSFGTLLLGKALHQNPDLEVQRIVTLGCILRPDFDWATLVERGQVEAVLNHYGTRDGWVKRAHATIPDAGPAGRRGFDLYEERWPRGFTGPGERRIFNVPAEGFDHSDFFDDTGRQPTTLRRVFGTVWRPFLTTRQIADVQPALERRGNRVLWPRERWEPHRWPRRALTGGWSDARFTYRSRPQSSIG